LVAAGKGSPKTAKLVQSVESWAKSVADQAQKDGPISQRFGVDDWILDLTLIAGGAKDRYDKSIGVMNGKARWIAPHLDLRKALESKSTRYGSHELPLLLVVADTKGQLFGAEDVRVALTEAVMGDEVVHWREGEEEARSGRKSNGFWRGAKGPRNRHVSGVLLFPDAGVWALRSEELQPILAVNPWADRSLPSALMNLAHFEVRNERWVYTAGQNVGDLLHMPNPWPPKG